MQLEKTITQLKMLLRHHSSSLFQKDPLFSQIENCIVDLETVSSQELGVPDRHPHFDLGKSGNQSAINIVTS